MITKVRKWDNDVSIVQFSKVDGEHSGSVTFTNKEQWERVKKNVDRYFRIKLTRIEVTI